MSMVLLSVESVFAIMFFVFTEFQSIAILSLFSALTWLLLSAVSVHAGHQHHPLSVVVTGALGSATFVKSFVLIIVAAMSSDGAVASFWRRISSYGGTFSVLQREAQFEWSCCGWEGPHDAAVSGCDMLLTTTPKGCKSDALSAWEMFRIMVMIVSSVSLFVSGICVVCSAILACAERQEFSSKSSGRAMTDFVILEARLKKSENLQKIVLIQSV